MPTNAARAWEAAIGTVLARSGLLTRLVVLVAAATLPAFGVLVLLTRDLVHEQEQRRGGAMLAQGRMVAQALADVARGAHDVALTLSLSPDVRRHDPACASLLSSLTAGLPQYGFLLVLDADLQPVCGDDAGRHADVALLDLARQALASGEFVPGRFSANGGQPVLDFGVAGPGGGMAVGGGVVVLGGISLAWLDHRLGAIRGAGTVTVLDADSTVLARQPEGAGWAGRAFVPPAGAAVARVGMGGAGAVSTDGAGDEGEA